MLSEPLESDHLDHSRRHERLGNLGQASARRGSKSLLQNCCVRPSRSHTKIWWGFLPIVDADVVLLRRAFPVQPPPAVQTLVLEDNRRQITVEDTGDKTRPAIKKEGPEDVVTRWVHFTSDGIGNAGVT